MGRKKEIRYIEINTRENIILSENELYTCIKGNWNEKYFKNNNPIVVELGCGRGEYSVGLAEIFPDRNFVGIDVKGERMWMGSTIAIERKLNNVAFVRTEIQFLNNFFSDEEISEIWIPFSDPRPKTKEEKHRLSNAKYLHLYKKLLKPEGWINFKTDNTLLFEYTLGILNVKDYPIYTEIKETSPEIKDLEFTFDLYKSGLEEIHHGIKTKFEEKFLLKNQPIHYLRFRFK